MNVSSGIGSRLKSRLGMPWLIMVLAILAVIMVGGLVKVADALSAYRTAENSQQVYPNRAITIIVTFPPGGGTDLLARKLGIQLEQQLGVPVIVENRPGASGNIGARATAAAKPDGYTLLMVNSSFAINPGVYSDPGFSPSEDFQAIFNAAWVPSIIVANPASNMTDLMQLRQQAAGQNVSVASCGNGTPQHLALQMLHEAAKVPLQHIPYKGCGPALTDVLSGTVPVGVVTLSSAMSLIKSGALHPLAVTAAQRTSLLPEVPTVAEQGLQGYELNQWHGLLAPAAVPADRLDRLADTLQAIIITDAMKQDLHALGYSSGQQTRLEFQDLIMADIKRFGALTARMGLRAD